MPERTFVRKLAAASLVVSSFVACVVATAGAESTAAAVSVIGRFPNWATARDSEEQATSNAHDWSSQHTQLIVDSPNHLAFEANYDYESTFQSTCTMEGGGAKIVKYDLDTAQPLGQRCIK